MISLYYLPVVYVDMHPTEQATDADTTIRLKETTHRDLKQLKPESITFDQLINMLLNEIETVDYKIAIEQSDS